MNKIELGWTFGKVYVWVAWLEWRVGLPFTWKSSSKAQMIKTKNLTSPNLLLTESLPALTVSGSLARNCVEPWSGVPVRLALQRPTGDQGSVSFLLPNAGCFLQGILSVVIPQLLLEYPHILFLFRKSCPLCVAGEKRLIHCCESEFVYCGFQMYL